MLTPDQARDRAADLIARARAAGADAADAVLVDHRGLSVSVRMGALEEVGRSESTELGLRVFCGARSASVATTDLSPAALDALAARAVAMARLAPDDPWAGLAPADRLMTAAPPDLDLDDGGEVAPERLRALASEAEEAARAVPGVTNSEGADAHAGRTVSAIATSHGFAAAYAATSHSLSASVLAGEGGAMERDHAHHTARHAADLEAPATICARAGERAVARRNPGRMASGARPVVFDPRVGAGLIGHLIGAIAGPAIARGTSFLRDALGTRVLPMCTRIVEEPLRPRGLRSRPFDGEGLMTAARAIVDDGVLQTWLLDSASARQLGLAPTGHAARGTNGAPGVGTANLHLAPGAIDPAALIADIAEGVYVTELIGQGVNLVTGDYSRGAAGFRIAHGAIAEPVSEFTIAGNLTAMLAALTPADDLELRYGINVPTLRIDAMTIASG